MSTDVAGKNTQAYGMEVTIHTPGGDVKLNPMIVRRYLVNGDGPVSDQEIAMFLGLCKYQNLNPFLREAYLIKYGSQPATIVTAKEVFLKRARRSEQFQGYRAGVIYLAPDSKDMSYTEGIVPPGGKLAGGWAEVHMHGWTFPLKVEVSFDEYVGRRKDGMPNRMWQEKPATMIRKVALVQALREAFPDTYQGMYSEEEVSTDELPKEAVDVNEVIDISDSKSPSETEPETPGHKPRRRANKFAGLDPSVYGTAELNTCGATPEQLLELRGYMRTDAGVAAHVKTKLESIGYSELSYLRQDEAQELLDLLRPATSTVSELDVPDDLVDCIIRPGERPSISRHCKPSCKDRAASGFCPALGEDPPAVEGGMI